MSGDCQEGWDRERGTRGSSLGKTTGEDGMRERREEDGLTVDCFVFTLSSYCGVATPG